MHTADKFWRSVCLQETHLGEAPVTWSLADWSGVETAEEKIVHADNNSQCYILLYVSLFFYVLCGMNLEAVETLTMLKHILNFI